METVSRRLFLPIICLCAFVLVNLSGCSGGGGGGSSITPPGGNGETTLKTGVFIDSAVDGVEYKALASSGAIVRTGVTDGGGKFLYKDGEVVSFHIGDITLGEAFAKGEITPVDLVPGAYNETNEKVTNIARLLQSLDHDGQPENGITISAQVRSGCKGKNLNMVLDSADAVEQGMGGAVQDFSRRGFFPGTVPRTPRSADQARTHMRETLANRDKDVKRGAMAQFRDQQELETYFREQYASRLLSTPVYGIYLTSGTGTVSTATPANASSGDTLSYSTTNLQEAGVDESDLVKNNGQYLYAAGNHKITISKIYPADSMQVAGSVEVKGNVDSLYLYKQTLVVLYRPDNSGEVTSSYVCPAVVGAPCGVPFKAKTGVLMVNVATPYKPEKILDFVADGSLVASRITGGKLHLVQQFYPELSGLKSWYDGTEQNRKTVVDANRKALAALTVSDFTPSYSISDSKGVLAGSGPLVKPENFYRPLEPEGGKIVSITTFSLDDLSAPFTSMGMVADATTVYASPGSLYLAATRWDVMPMTGIMPASQSAFEETVIHKLDLGGNQVTALGSATVKGRLLNQYSLGEYDNVLRVATTTGSSSSSANHVYCLKMADSSLMVIGKLENLAMGERIYSARFIGSRGFLVTFKKIDPLHTLDLSDPANPKVAGELKVPGYSDYLHLLDANHLLAIGKDAKQDTPESNFAWYQGMQLSIFDISNFSKPTLLHKELIGVRGTDSEALANPKAFTFLPEKNLLAFPVNVYEFTGTTPQVLSAYGNSVFKGLYVYRVTSAKGFELLGKIAASLETLENRARGVFIDNMVYAVTQNSVTSASTDNMSLSGYLLGW